MGLFRAEIQEFLRTVKDRGIRNRKLIMIGKQDILVNKSDLMVMLREFNIEIDAGAAKQFMEHEKVDSKLFFEMAGFEEVHSLDYSDYEGADVIFDLNGDLPADLKYQ